LKEEDFRMKLMRFFMCSFVLMFVLTAGFASAEDRGTAEEAKALVKKAVAYAKEVGKEKALAEINNPKGKFVYKDLYVFAGSPSIRICLAHPMTPPLVGKQMSGLKDADGNRFLLQMVEKRGSGVVDYRWTHPQTKKIEPKSSYYETIDSMDMFLSCGYYK
jgi:cytochrome c